MKYILFILLAFSSLTIKAQNKLTPNMEVTDMNGSRHNLPAIVKGELPVIITFWATWCKPCQEELTTLAEMKDEWLGKVRIVAISVDDARASMKVRSFVSGRNWPFEVFQDSNQELKRSLNIADIPYVLITDGEGKILYRHTGYTPGSESILIEKALKVKSK